MLEEAGRSYGICIGLYGSCRCQSAGRDPCAAIEHLVDEGMDADDERDRISDQCQPDGEFEY